MIYWLVIGPEKNWHQTLEGKKVWGVPPFCRELWGHIRIGDIMLFYAMRPIKGLVGYGTVSSTFEDETPYWSQELIQNSAYWPYRIKLEKVNYLPTVLWKTQSIPVKNRGLQRALQRLPESQANKFLQDLDNILSAEK